ncbi:Stk1 family PASTA domain-containing Ser/Thr kinase [Schwartzia succinivorans]|jgi:serine/threonine-protein kinase|uniref:non-specific serine/threonine protein kinase n=1 Tax=Schwartzia succinivorans DSM 10502 TaxID=1123243 RepID=A0A1M4WE94_9FIRM|nr:Stk1 family PASTA domain-containing Ser/Thr kinase [Schwartzia succinivorans]SHE79505.1 serine/threonine protein kinase [Schwartzia succinivorans DSM 10502]
MLQGVLDNRYEILERIGGGGMADVYKAHDKILDRVVAVKILHAQLAGDKEFLAKFQMEAQGAARLSHPNIVNIYDVGVEDGMHYIVMEYVDGETLKDKITREGHLSIPESLKIAKEIAEALSHAHKNNLVHCDVKPHNILVMQDGRVKVADFGIARAVTSTTMTYNGNVVGSVHYFSPEQAKGTKITPKSDVYSLGVVLYEMLTGHLPFTGETTVSVALKHLQDQPRSIRSIDAQIPAVVEAIVFKAMSKDPNDRPDASGMAEDIASTERLLGFKQETVPAVDPFATQMMPRVTEADLEIAEDEEPQQPVYKSRKFIFSIVAVLVLGFAIGAFLSFGKFWSSAEITVPDVTGRPVALAKQLLEAQNLRVNIAETYDANVPAGQVAKQSPEAGSVVKEQRVITIYVSKGGEELTMPDLKGLSKSAVEEKLRKMGLVVGSVYMKESDKDVGTVLDQDPQPGSKINKGKSVDITVSKGKKVQLVKVPDFTGGTIDAAKSSLKSLGLKVGSVSKQNSKQAPGTIISQSPNGTSVEEGTSIDFVVSNGKAPSTGKNENTTQSSGPSKQNESGKSNN